MIRAIRVPHQYPSDAPDSNAALDRDGVLPVLADRLTHSHHILSLASTIDGMRGTDDVTTSWGQLGDLLADLFFHDARISEHQGVHADVTFDTDLITAHLLEAHDVDGLWLEGIDPIAAMIDDILRHR